MAKDKSEKNAAESAKLNIVTFGKRMVNLALASVWIEKTHEKVRDPYDLRKTVDVSYDTLFIRDIGGETFKIDLLDQDDPTVRRIDAWLKSGGLKIDFAKGDIVYVEDAA